MINLLVQKEKKLEYVKTRYDKTETGFIQENRVYECSDCSSCPHKSECTKAQGNRQIRFNKKLWQLKNVARRNLMSEKGLEMRGKRAEYLRRNFWTNQMEYGLQAIFCLEV